MRTAGSTFTADSREMLLDDMHADVDLSSSLVGQEAFEASHDGEKRRKLSEDGSHVAMRAGSPHAFVKARSAASTEESSSSSSGT